VFHGTIQSDGPDFSNQSKEVVMTDTERLGEEEGKELLRAARETIKNAILEETAEGARETAFSPKFSERRGTFVTLTIDGRLRGCIGHIVPRETLWDGVKGNAIQAAFRDPRFPPLSKNELGRVKIEVSILTEPRPLPYSDADDLKRKLKPGSDGVIIKKGYHQATFLPQVWEQLPEREDFLTHLCLKAGLSGDAWKHKKIEVSTYQVQAFEEE
jgi:AmmeMemoRadiSam system protein A